MLAAESKPDAAVAREIEAVVRDYFQGYLKAEPETLLKAFDRRSRLMSVDEGALDITETAQWLDNLEARRKKGDVRAADAAIVGLDVSGDAAVVKTTLAFPAFTFTDYLSLLKFGDAWKIVHKIYTSKKIRPPR